MSENNDKKSSENQQEENQEQKVGIMAPTPCCSGCINVDPVNGCSVAEGSSTEASGFAAHAEGTFTLATQSSSHAEGNITKATGGNAHAEGQGSEASGISSHAEGEFTVASGDRAHAEGDSTLAFAHSSHAEGFRTSAGVPSSGVPSLGEAAHAEGEFTRAEGRAAHAEGRFTTASEFGAHAEGRSTIASGEASHAEGASSVASGAFSHAEGDGTTASVTSSHAEGQGTLASSTAAHAEGIRTTASEEASHAEGFRTTASGIDSHAEGSLTNASGFASHAEGDNTIASGRFSHTEGTFTSTNSFDGAHIMGKFGDADEAYSWFLANGTSISNKGLAAKILTTGIGVSDRGWRGGGADYAEMFETVDGKPIDVGYFVTLEGDKIRKANKKDDYILGIVSADPAILADSGELRWKDKYVTDEWGRVQYHDVTIPEKKDKEGKVIIPARTETQPILNPDWDNTKEYIPRSKRSEWVAVGLLGKLLVRDDGTCQVNDYCRPNSEGLATASSQGYRVMKLTGPNQILILFK